MAGGTATSPYSFLRVVLLGGSGLAVALEGRRWVVDLGAMTAA